MTLSAENRTTIITAFDEFRRMAPPSQGSDRDQVWYAFTGWLRERRDAHQSPAVGTAIELIVGKDAQTAPTREVDVQDGTSLRTDLHRRFSGVPENVASRDGAAGGFNLAGGGILGAILGLIGMFIGGPIGGLIGFLIGGGVGGMNVGGVGDMLSGGATRATTAVQGMFAGRSNGSGESQNQGTGTGTTPPAQTGSLSTQRPDELMANIGGFVPTPFGQPGSQQRNL